MPQHSCECRELEVGARSLMVQGTIHQRRLRNSEFLIGIFCIFLVKTLTQITKLGWRIAHNVNTVLGTKGSAAFSSELLGG